MLPLFHPALLLDENNWPVDTAGSPTAILAIILEFRKPCFTQEAISNKTLENQVRKFLDPGQTSPTKATTN